MGAVARDARPDRVPGPEAGPAQWRVMPEVLAPCLAAAVARRYGEQARPLNQGP